MKRNWVRLRMFALLTLLLGLMSFSGGLVQADEDYLNFKGAGKAIAEAIRYIRHNGQIRAISLDRVGVA